MSDCRKMIFSCLWLLAAFAVHAAELPKFTDYPVAVTEIDRFAKAIVPAVRGSSRCIRDLAYDRPEKPNFADRFTLAVSGCGSGCAEFCLIDRVTGRVFPGIDSIGGPKIEFMRDSRLIIVTHTDGMYADTNPFYADCYLWESDRLRFVGRWGTTFGLAKNNAQKIDWVPLVAFEPNPPNWRS